MSAAPAAKKRFTPADIQARLHTRMNQPNPASTLSGAVMGSIIRLSARRVRPYEGNPRTVTNAKMAEIKESIRARGIDQMIKITQRPGQDFYITAAGGNTRLTSVHLLFEETKDPKFDEIDFIITPYVSERQLLAAHLIENNSRSDLCFWDNARSIMDLGREIEKERGKSLSLRDLSTALALDGVVASHAWIAVFKFAVEHLTGLEGAAKKLTSKDVQDRLKPTYSRIAKLATKFEISEEQADLEIYAPEIELARLRDEQNPDVGFSAESLIEGFHSRAAALITVERSELDRLFHIIEKQPDLSASDLRALLKPQQGTLPSVPEAGASEHGPAGAAHDEDASPDRGEDEDEDEDDGTAGGAVAGASAGSNQTARPPISGPAGPKFTSSSSSIHVVDQPPASTAGLRQAEPETASYPLSLEVAGDPTTAKSTFLAALNAFAHACHLSECIRSTDALPLWFMVEPPVLEAGEAALDTQAANGLLPERYYGWWWLAFVSKQNTPAGLSLIPDGLFSRICVDNESWERACFEILGEQVQPDQFYRIIAAMCDPENDVGPLYLDFIRALRQVRQAFPERFVAAFWTQQGVDAAFAEEI